MESGDPEESAAQERDGDATDEVPEAPERAEPEPSRLVAGEAQEATGRAARSLREELLTANERVARSASEELLKANERSVRALAGLGISDTLKMAFGRTAKLTSSVDNALAHLRVPSVPASFSAPELVLSPPELSSLVLPNPALETNKQLAELSQTTGDLVGIAQTQAEIFQSVAETLQLVLQEAIRSGKQARSATRLAAAGIATTLLIALGTLLYNHSQHEIQVLQEISREQRAAADRQSQDQLRALSEILQELQKPKTITPNNPRPKPSTPSGEEQQGR